ncbi:hypothetical protein BCR22_07475 [Enterococcus plantarum]|uniref:hypothetical protein n=1 Tax=Enterococcus plantarum TaxID=1077675 RepID=UPI00084D625A|nr:hypothetical protein [Enterococcus plantarum]OEG09426.1 hypothetical protein BCR22_07475 [Enterococcus plantarum]
MKKINYLFIVFGFIVLICFGSQEALATVEFYDQVNVNKTELYRYPEGRSTVHHRVNGLTITGYIPNPSGGVNLPNDRLSGLWVPAGYRAIVTENDNYKGRTLTVENRSGNLNRTWINSVLSSTTIDSGGIINLSEYGLSRKVSSIIVEQIKNDATNPIVYEDHGFGARSQILNVGNYRKKNLSFGNDRISSIRVPKGYTVQMWDDDKYKDRNYTFVGPINIPFLEGFNDKVSSLKVWKN